MREKNIKQRSLFEQAIKTCLAVFKPEIELEKMDAVISANPEIIEAVQEDIGGLERIGREGITVERITRCAILKQYKGYSYRELVNRLNDGVRLRWFSRFGIDPIPHFTTLQKLIKAIKVETWEFINDILVNYAKMKKIENGKSLRVDTTVTETDISYPVDARLLNDSVRVLDRIMKKAVERIPCLDFGYADRTRRTKKRCYQVVMAKGKNASKNRKIWYRDLLKAAEEVLRMSERCNEALRRRVDIESIVLRNEFSHYLPLVEKAISQCERRVIKEEEVPAREKIVSIFEEHTDIIVRGKSGCPVEFGHKILVSSGKSGLITHIKCYRGNSGDSDMSDEILEKHASLYKKAPCYLSADRRFFSASNENKAYDSGVKKVSIVKSGYQSKERKAIQKSRWFKKLQRFRAGIEGIISGLMRCYGLKRCLWKGWESFKSYVGLSVVTFNLQKIAQLI